MNHHPHEIEPVTVGRPQVLRVHVGGDVAIDVFANAALRWLCRAGLVQAVRIVGVVR